MTRLSVDYYPEHWNRERWQRDFELMRDAGVTAVRMGEFAWCRLEPEPDRYEFSWLQEAVDLASHHGIQSILCTPTAAPPAWLVELHPDILPTDADGRQIALGARRHCDPNSHSFRERSMRITKAMAAHFQTVSSVFAWQIDNEIYGNTPSYSGATRDAFHTWIQKHYPSVEDVNSAWGTIFWSGEYRSVNDIPLPGGNPGPDATAHHPSLRLEFHRFVSASWAEFVREQAAILRGVNSTWILTTNAYLFRWGMDMNHRDLFECLDVYSFDNYSHSLHENSFYCSFARSIKPRFWILEQQSASPHAQHEFPSEHNRLSRYTRAVVSHGCELVSFFRWRQCRFGQEQHHGAILPHTGEPGDLYDELKELSRGLATDPPVPSEGPEVGVYFSWEDGWIREIDGSRDYVTVHVESIHQGLYNAGARVTYLFCADDVEAFSLAAPTAVLICPMKMIRDDGLSIALLQAARGGLTVYIGSDYGAKDRHNVFHEELIPAEIARSLGIRVLRRFRLQTRLETESGYTVTTRFDEIELAGAEAIDYVTVDTGGSGSASARLPIVTVRTVGAGKLCYVAGLLDHAFWATVAG